MGTKTISVTDAAYHRLAKAKRPGESFTDVILRLTTRARLRDLPDVVSPSEARALADAIAQSRNERYARRAERLGGDAEGRT